MAIKQYNPTTPARRGMTTADTDTITTNKPVKSLTVAKTRKSGRNNQGRITTRHRGGGVKRRYRLVDFRQLPGFSGVIEEIEYDPNRSAYIARIKHEDDSYSYVLAGKEMTVGMTIEAGDEVEIKAGNRMPLRVIPVGSFIYNIELEQGKGGQIARSAGAKVQLMAREGKYAYVRMPSGEIRLINVECSATIGAVGNENHQNIKIGSAGRNRRKGKRPSVRGRAMNAADHPMGGGDGGAGSLGHHPTTPWGKKSLGAKTRKRKETTKYIVRGRKKGRR